jgi:hypothetical protein
MFAKIRRVALLAASGAVMAGLVATAGAGLASATPAHDGGCWCIQADRPAASSPAAVTTAAMTPAAVTKPLVEGPGYPGWVAGNGVRVRQWPTTSAPVLGLAYYGQRVGVLSWGPVWDEIIWNGREAWISGRYVVSDGTNY